MAYDVKIKGNRDLMQVDADLNDLIGKWEKYKNKEAGDSVVRFPNWTGMLSQIDSFKKIANNRSEDTFFDEYSKYPEPSPEEKARMDLISQDVKQMLANMKVKK